MAKKSALRRNEKLKKIVQNKSKTRLAIKDEIRKNRENPEQVFQLFQKLSALGRNASPTRIRNRCAESGSPRSYSRQFGLSRRAIRQLALEGLLPGVKKSSW